MRQQAETARVLASIGFDATEALAAIAAGDLSTLKARAAGGR
jgi:hypothetical protein